MFKRTAKCRIFISRKTSDNNVSALMRDKLKKWAPNTLDFFDATNIEPGAKWREKIREELSKANIFFLVLTKPARKDFDWPLYEAGLFESLGEEDRRRIICIYADSMEGPPDQLGDIQGVKATPAGILALLKKLFREQNFSLTIKALNKTVGEEDLAPIAKALAKDISGVGGDEVISRRYTNAFIQLLIPANVESLEPHVTAESDQASLKNLFGLSEKAPGQLWTWEEIVNEVSAGFDRRWIEQLGEAISAMRKKHAFKQLTGRFLGRDGKLYRPEIEIYRTLEDKRMIIDVTFSEQVQDTWLRDAGAPVALAANLALASRIRHDLIERYLKKVRYWQPESSEEGFAEFSRLVEKIEHDGHFIGQLSQVQLQEAFEHEDQIDAFYAIGLKFVKEIKPLVHDALGEKDVKKLHQALQLWEKNNLQFLEIGLRRYEEMLGLQPAVQKKAA